MFDNLYAGLWNGKPLVCLGSSHVSWHSCSLLVNTWNVDIVIFVGPWYNATFGWHILVFSVCITYWSLWGPFWKIFSWFLLPWLSKFLILSVYHLNKLSLVRKQVVFPICSDGFQVVRLAKVLSFLVTKMIQPSWWYYYIPCLKAWMERAFFVCECSSS